MCKYETRLPLPLPSFPSEAGGLVSNCNTATSRSGLALLLLCCRGSRQLGRAWFDVHVRPEGSDGCGTS